jgi:hypothetical protein
VSHPGPGESTNTTNAASSAILSAVQQAAGSALFRKAPAQRELLLYLAKHRDQTPPSEYSIGVDVFGRKPDFDPKTDATVRVQISRLRQRLKDYYETEGKHDASRIHIPMGDYRIDLLDAPEPPVAPTPLPPPPPATGSRRNLAIAVLCVALAALAIDDIRLRSSSTAESPRQLHPFWLPMVRKGTPIHIIVPAPLFFRWEKQPYVARDFNVNSLDQLPRSPYLSLLRDKFGEPETNQLYTVASDTLAASSVARYLQDRGVPASVLDTPTATVDLLSSQDTIVFLGPGTARQLSPLTDTNFYLQSGTGGVTNRNPAPGEPAQFPGVELAPLRSTNHGVLALLPGKAPGTRLLLFASVFNPALASLTTTPAELDSLHRFHQTHGASPFFEIVVRFERNADRVLRVTPVAYRAVPASR